MGTAREYQKNPPKTEDFFPYEIHEFKSILELV